MKLPLLRKSYLANAVRLSLQRKQAMEQVQKQYPREVLEQLPDEERSRLLKYVLSCEPLHIYETVIKDILAILHRQASMEANSK